MAQVCTLLYGESQRPRLGIYIRDLGLLVEPAGRSTPGVLLPSRLIVSFSLGRFVSTVIREITRV